MQREQGVILNALLDKYEMSKTFLGNNKVQQSIFVRTEKLFPGYGDDAQYEIYTNTNAAIKELERQCVVSGQRLRNGVVQKVTLPPESLEVAYKLCNRTPKKDILFQLSEVWSSLLAKEEESLFRQILTAYISGQKERIEQNKQVAYFDGDLAAYQDMLMAIREILKNQTEQFIRDFSVRILGNSKKLELMEDKVRSFLYEYGEGAEKEGVLEEYGIVKTPSYVAMKGEAILELGGQSLDLSRLQGDISLSTVTLGQVTGIKIKGERIVTVENLTSFHTFDAKNSFVIYLGGFHNQTKRIFLKMIYESNPEKRYFHFGDIDAGGFYIYEHLIEKTGIAFTLLHMNIDTLQRHKEAWLKLTENDRRRIGLMLNKDGTTLYREVLEFMLKYNCKLEQEAIYVNNIEKPQ
jgi:hypothetical protein